MPRLLAGFIARAARAANIGPDSVDGAGSRYADFAHQGGTALAVASHAAEAIVDELAGDMLEIGIVLGREPRPLARERAAGAAGSAERT
jgi:hypothetical protein